MGYQTSYQLEWTPRDDAINQKIADYIAGNEDMSYALETDGSTSESRKWYDNEDDMRKMSREIQGILFTLSGEGEESGDIWKAYFRDGKMQLEKATITVAPFDESKLK